MTTVRVRFAPSPTGELHIGSVRTTLYNYLFARQNGGRLLLRIEDTDQERLVPSAIDSIYDGLHWLGIGWDEGPREGGPHAPYVQSERLTIYAEHAAELVASDAGYACFCTKERLAEMRREQEARHELTRYDRRCRVIAPTEARARIDAGEPHTIRLKVPEEGTIGATDLIHGDVSWDLRTIEDAILLKSDGFPTYHLAVVIDDHLMEISHILRGDEWLPSLPKHLLLYRAFGWDAPAHAHLPTVLGPDHKKLSKRHGSTAVKEFRDEGYLPEALVNFLALIGWSSGTEDEVFSMADLVERWKLSQVQPSPGIWDRERLNYFNGIWIRRMSPDDFVTAIAPYLPDGASPDVVRAAAPLVQERVKTFAEARPMLEFLFTDRLEYPDDLLVDKRHGAADTRAALDAAGERLGRAPFAHEEIEAALRALAAELGWKNTDLFMAVRVAVTGKKVGPPLIESLLLLGRDRALARVDAAARRLRKDAA